jgi:hypothetical protein
VRRDPDELAAHPAHRRLHTLQWLSGAAYFNAAHRPGGDGGDVDDEGDVRIALHGAELARCRRAGVLVDD